MPHYHLSNVGRNRELVRRFDKTPAPAFAGKNWRAVLHHPRLPVPVELFAVTEREARRQAWRLALATDLRGFVITAEKTRGALVHV